MLRSRYDGSKTLPSFFTLNAIEDSRQKADCCLVVLSAENFLIGETHDHLPADAAKTIVVVNKMLAMSTTYCYRCSNQDLRTELLGQSKNHQS
jgi:hypothetical protein